MTCLQCTEDTPTGGLIRESWRGRVRAQAEPCRGGFILTLQGAPKCIPSQSLRPLHLSVTGSGLPWGGVGINSQAFPVSAGVFKACLGALKAVLQRELQEQESEARSEGSGGLHSNYKRDWRASGQGTGCVAASHKEKPESIIKSPKCA